MSHPNHHMHTSTKTHYLPGGEKWSEIYPESFGSGIDKKNPIVMNTDNHWTGIHPYVFFGNFRTPAYNYFYLMPQ